MTRVIVIRHGETEWNQINRYQGQLDSALTERGRQQAERVGRRLAEEPFDVLYSSDLGRAVDTAKAISGACGGREIQTDTNLRERHFGILGGLTRSEARARHPVEEQGYLHGGPDYRIPDGESLRDVYLRVVSGLDAICERHAGQRIAVVTHGGVLGMLFRHAVGLSLEAPRYYRFFNASFNEFEYQNGQWVLATWGDVAHLRDIGTDDDM